MTEPAPPTSRLLSLPAELRNTIYELAFSSDHDAGTSIDIRTATPPSNALLLSCRQVHSEAHLLFLAAYRTFWTTNTFTLKIRADSPTSKQKRAFKKFSHDLEHVKHFEIIVQADTTLRGQLFDAPTTGLWIWRAATHKEHYLMVQSSGGVLYRMGSRTAPEVIQKRKKCVEGVKASQQILWVAEYMRFFGYGSPLESLWRKA